MKVLVLGGTRFFGRNLVSRLVKSKDEVYVASRKPLDGSIAQQIEWIEIDRKSSQSLTTKLSKHSFDLVIDQICYDEHDAKIFLDSFVGRVGRLLMTSTVSVYDVGSNLDETFFSQKNYKWNESNPNAYQEGKRRAEQILFNQDRVPVCMVRVPLVLGPNDWTRRLHWHLAMIKFRREIFLPNINAKIPFTHEDEIAEFMEWIGKSEFVGPINMASANPIPVKDVIEMIQKVSGEHIIQAKTGDELNHSPFGVPNDWTVNTELAQKLGFKFSSTKDWMEKLIAKLFPLVTELDLQKVSR